MQTYSHVIIAAFVAQRLTQRHETAQAGEHEVARTSPLRNKAFLLGSVAPDIPLILLTVIFLASDLLLGPTAGRDSRVAHLFRYQFYHDPWVIAAYNALHAPLVILALGAAGIWAWRLGRRWGGVLFWFAVACLVHTLVDIPLHHDDGPLLLYPFDWETRFRSPVSYWDPERYRIPFSIAEHLVALGLGVTLIAGRIRRRRHSRAAKSG